MSRRLIWNLYIPLAISTGVGHAAQMWSYPMLDIAYLVVGALFLGGCVLYALVCDHL